MATELDSIVEAFEEARAAGEASNLRHFLPPPGSESYRVVALELMRVDLEYGWEEGAPRSLQDYVAEYGDVLADRAALAALSFEEFRLRRAAGQAVRREEYARRFQIDTSVWPEDTAQPSTATFPQVGETLLGFRLLRELGRGAFGRVYLAEQADLAHRHVALKVTTEVTVEPERLAQLQHANIVPIYSLHRHEGRQVLCMPYRGDRTLADWLRDRRDSLDRSRALAADTANARLDDTNAVAPPEHLPAVSVRAQGQEAARNIPISADDALRLMRGIAQGLAHAHERGIVHRDLKPANILLADDGAPLLLDFNLAAQAHAEARVEGAGGTLPYMSPEQLESLQTGAAVSAPSDVFACGVLLIEMLTGERPFAEHNAHGRVLWRTLHAERLHGYSHWDRVRRTASADVASIARKCLAPRPQDRYRSGVELADDLGRHLENLPLKHAVNRAPRERLRKWARRHPRLGSAASVGTLAMLLLIAAGVTIYARGRQLAKLAAVSTRAEYLRKVPEVRAALSTPDLDPELLRTAVAEAEQLLSPYVVNDATDWRATERLTALQNDERDAMVLDVGSTLRALAGAIERLPRGTQDDLATEDWRQRAAEESQSVNGSAASQAAMAREATARKLLAHQYPAAADEAERWLALAPQDFEAHFLLGNALVGSGRADEAEHRFAICAALAPTSAMAFFQRGLCRLEMGFNAGAEADFSRVLTLRPGFPPGLINRAIARERLNDLKGALNDLNLALATERAPTRAYFMRARVYQRLGKTAEADADRARGLSLEPGDPLSWTARGVAQLPNAERALADFQAALKLNPVEPSALQSAASVLSENLGRPDDAIELLSKLIASRPRDANAIAGRAVLHARLGHADAAIADVARLNDVPTTAVHDFQAACVYALLAGREMPEHHGRALQALARALQRDPICRADALTDADLASLREDKEFQRMIAAARILREAAGAEKPKQP